ncbi:hypothetical protein NL676_018947 [Syzygium grande]|nr:hypothetical protein NL676_018947 [Syzygium grande]
MNGPNRKCLLFPNFRRQDNRLKALQIAVAVPGFQSLSLKGADREVIEVTGDRVDAVNLVNKLRKSKVHAKLEMVEDVKEEKEEEKPEEREPLPLPPLPLYIMTEPEPPCCTIM